VLEGSQTVRINDDGTVDGCGSDDLVEYIYKTVGDIPNLNDIHRLFFKRKGMPF